MQAPGISSYPVDWQQKISEKILEEQIITDLLQAEAGSRRSFDSPKLGDRKSPATPTRFDPLLTRSLEVLHHASSCEGSGLVIRYVGCWVLGVEYGYGPENGVNPPNK